MTDIRTAMPLLARHEGVWDGVYTYFNAANEKVDEHASRLLCRIPDGYASGAEDGKVKLWGEDFSPKGEIDMGKNKIKALDR